MSINELTEKQYNAGLKEEYGNNIPIKKTLSYEFLETALSHKKEEMFTVGDIVNKFLKKTGVRLDYGKAKSGLKKLVNNWVLTTDGWEYWKPKNSLQTIYYQP